MEDYTFSLVRLRDYFGKSEKAREKVFPGSPGLYYWLPSIGPHCFFEGEGVDSIENILLKPTKEFYGGFKPYYFGRIGERPPKISGSGKKALTNLKTEYKSGSSVLEWMLGTTTLLSRPLYVGKAKDLSIRLPDHLEGRTDLREKIESEIGLNILDCAVCVLQIPFSEKMEEKEVENSLTGAESLLIRASRPILNEKMD